MYGLVVAVHLLSLFSAPDVLSGLQGFAFWAIGLHYYHGLSGGGGGKLAAALERAREGAADEDGGRGGRRGEHEVHLVLYIAAMALLVALRARRGAARVVSTRPRDGGGKGVGGQAGGRWAPAGGVRGKGARGGRRGRPRRRAGEEEEEEEEEEEAGFSPEPLSDEISDSSEGEADEAAAEAEAEAEEPLRFPKDGARDRRMSVQGFAASFLAKFPADTAQRQVQTPDGNTLALSKQFLRDVPTMVRVNGAKVAGATPEEKAAAAYAAIQRACAALEKAAVPEGVEGGRKYCAPGDVMALSTQNLGIFLYEEIVTR